MIVDSIEPSLDDVVFASYDGDTDKNSGLYHGTGSAVLDNDCTYQGKFSNGLFHGKGKFIWADGISFEGEFVLGKMNGKGTYTWHDGSTYKGEIKNGLRHGVGKFTGSSGQFYEGDWREGKRCGNGRISYNEEKTSSYVGEWADNMRHGYGVMKYPSGNNYEGMWRNDLKHGNGVMTWRDVDELYTGSWFNGHPHGHGEHIWGDNNAKTVKKQMCNMYRGHFNRGKRDGLGSFFYMNGSQYTGQWINDMKEGEGVFIHPDGKIYSGLFLANRMVPVNDQQSVQPRATDDVNPQYALNIEDVFQRYPVTSDTADNSQSYDFKKKELERVLLKYNHCIKQAHKRYCELTNKIRAKEVLALLTAAQTNTAGLNNHDKIVQTIKNARNFSKRLFCLNLGQMTRFLHESGLVDSSFTSYDVSRCLRRMKSNQESTAVTLLQEYKRQAARLEGSSPGAYDDSAASDFESDLQITAVLDSYYDSAAANDKDFDISSSQPILEREFCELFVRCIAEQVSRRGSAVGHMTLYRTIYQALAEKLLPFVSDYEGHTPTFYTAFYSDPVTELLSGSSSVLQAVWKHMQSTASSSRKSTNTIEVRSFVQFVLGAKTLVSDTDATTLIASLFISESNAKAVVDHSQVATTINYDDFTEVLCRLMLSELWVFGKDPVVLESEAIPASTADPLDENANPANAAAASGGEEAAGEPTKIELTKTELLSQRLGHFLSSFDVASLGLPSL